MCLQNIETRDFDREFKFAELWCDFLKPGVNSRIWKSLRDLTLESPCLKAVANAILLIQEAGKLKMALGNKITLHIPFTATAVLNELKTEVAGYLQAGS